MTDPATKSFISDYTAFNKSLSVPHPYFQQIQYVKVNTMIIKEVRKRRHQSILDVGSGTGHLIFGLSAISPGCVALDIETERLIYISKKAPNIKCVQANVDLGLPFSNDCFDIVIASELLEHLNEPKGFYKEVARILRKGGILILTTPNSDNLTQKILRRLPKSLALSLAKRGGVDLTLHPELMGNEQLDRSNPHMHKVEGYTKSELIALGKGSGLKTIFQKSFGPPLPDSVFSHIPKSAIRFIVNNIENHIPYALRHFIVYEALL
ncbi:MAG: class I SAM-dependent methyltransferase [Thermoplasmata archaeon]|nr:MAG: class I SAM-dependent methyltransferase [Thermoplasmata archaeon]